MVCGFNFTFGRGGRGNSELLRAYGKAHGFDVSVVPEVMLLGETVSSTRIRRLLSMGALDEATALLGHLYTLTGRVGPGQAYRADDGLPHRERHAAPRQGAPCLRRIRLPGWRRRAGRIRRW